MNVKFISILFCCIGTAYSYADGWVDLDGILVPTGQCVIDADANSYYFSCDSSSCTQDYYSGGDSSCSGTPNTTSCSFDYDCSPVGYIELNVDALACDFYTAATTALATGVCHESTFEDAYVKYSCDDATLIIQVYSDSSCDTLIGSNSTECYLIGEVDYNGSPVDAFVVPSDCISDLTTTGEPEPTTTSGSTTPFATNNETYTTTSSSSIDSDITTTDMATTLIETIAYNGSIPSVDLSEYYGGYFIYDVVGLEIPLPIDTCVPVALDGLAAIYGQIVCNNDGTEATFTAYSDITCETVSDDIESFVATSDDYTFNCDSSVNYASLILWGTDACSAFSVFELYAATGRCFYLDSGDDAAYTAITCDDDQIALYAFSDDECTNPIGYGKIVEGDCVELTVPLGDSTQTVYYAKGQCDVTINSGPTTTGTTTTSDPKDGAVSFGMGLSGFILITMSLFVASVAIV